MNKSIDEKTENIRTVIYEASEENIKLCARLLSSGELVAFPTETVYGLGANALNPQSVKRIYAAKGRPSDNPLIVHISSVEDVEKIAASVPEKARAVIENFMPGPVTVVLPKKPIVPNEVTGGLNTVAVRMPASKIALKLIAESGCPVCAPSANTSTRPSPTTAKHVYDDLNGKIPAILDGGECSVGVESTVIDFCSDKPRLLRAGGMELEKIEKLIGEIEVVKNSKVALCPGMKYKHYSPTAEVFVAIEGDEQAKRMLEKRTELQNSGVKTVIVCLDELTGAFDGCDVWSAGKTARDYAQRLFALLRRSDDEGYGAVVCQGLSDEGMGLSVNNRLSKACGGKFI